MHPVSALWRRSRPFPGLFSWAGLDTPLTHQLSVYLRSRTVVVLVINCPIDFMSISTRSASDAQSQDQDQAQAEGCEAEGVAVESRRGPALIHGMEYPEGARKA